jgi:hypothetical protein
MRKQPSQQQERGQQDDMWEAGEQVSPNQYSTKEQNEKEPLLSACQI